jgi:hypothetical protein
MGTIKRVTKISLNCHGPVSGGGTLDDDLKRGTLIITLSRPAETLDLPRGTALRPRVYETSFGRLPRPSILPVPHRR